MKSATQTNTLVAAASASGVGGQVKVVGVDNWGGVGRPEGPQPETGESEAGMGSWG